MSPAIITYCYLSMQCSKIALEVVKMAFPKKSEDDKYVRINVTMPPELQARLVNYCEQEERPASWCVQKALDEWLTEKGY